MKMILDAGSERGHSRRSPCMRPRYQPSHNHWELHDRTSIRYDHIPLSSNLLLPFLPLANPALFVSNPKCSPSHLQSYMYLSSQSSSISSWPCPSHPPDRLWSLTAFPTTSQLLPLAVSNFLRRCKVSSLLTAWCRSLLLDCPLRVLV